VQVRPSRRSRFFELNLLAYPDSADAEGSLADAYLADGAHGAPASSWTDTGEYRGEIRRDAEKILKKLDASTTK
jgi:hypothetical protein